MPTPRAQELGSSSAGYGDNLNDFASRVTNGYAPKDLLRTPVASEVDGGATAPEVAKAKGQTLRLSGQMIDMVAPNQLPKMPTPTSRDHKDGTKEHNRDGKVQTDTVARAVFNSGEVLLPTPTAVDGNTVAKSELDANDPKHRLKVAAQVIARDDISWGKFQPAIRRWEKTLGRLAPAPTKPDGKGGAHRLSSKFTEWMMGLPEGWITGVGLLRNDELKACGNGVVPQQAELALRMLLDGITVPSTGGGQVNLPTPTVSDTFTGSLKSSQQKDGSMHSVTLPQAVRMVTDV